MSISFARNLKTKIPICSKAYNSSAVDVQARISPSLGPCCAEFVHHAIELPDSFLPFQVEKNHFDFWQISKMQLLEAGLQEKNIHIAGICTSCTSDYFSYRRACRNGDCVTGRCATVISLVGSSQNGVTDANSDC